MNDTQLFRLHTPPTPSPSTPRTHTFSVSSPLAPPFNAVYQIFQIQPASLRFALPLPKDDKNDGKHILRETPSVGVTQRHEHLQRRGARAQRRAPRLHWASAPPAVGAAPHRTARTVARRNPRRAARAASHSRLAPAARATRTGVPADRARFDTYNHRHYRNAS